MVAEIVEECRVRGRGRWEIFQTREEEMLKIVKKRKDRIKILMSGGSFRIYAGNISKIIKNKKNI